jgi:sugar phosphate isomerase/epimerase
LNKETTLDNNSVAVDFPVGYCTNVHAGAGLEQARANLDRYAGSVRQHLKCSGKLPVGLWLAEPAANQLLQDDSIIEFRDWLGQRGLLPYTFNGFPQGDFHQAVIKHQVYEPTWSCHSRAAYSMRLAQVLDVLLPAGAHGSISTLPIGWPHCPWHAEELHLAADNLMEVARYLDNLAQHSGREIVLAIEPEPGCILNTAAEVVEFFQHYLLSGPDAKLARRFLTVCHDVCHSSVMFESQSSALEAYRRAGIRVGKVQLSSAVHVPWNEVLGEAEQQAAVLSQLRGFNEPKYLHQTTACQANGHLDRITEDLSKALQNWIPTGGFPANAWRVHFHVPIYLEQLGALRATQLDIRRAIEYFNVHGNELIDGAAWFSGHYEVETYAWPVLPESLQQTDLAKGIADELQYAADLLNRIVG